MGIERFSDRLAGRNYTGLETTTMLIEDLSTGTVLSPAIVRGLMAVYCNATTGCATAAPILQPVVDATFPPGTTLTTPASFLSLAPEPGSYDLAGTCPSETEATVLRVVEHTDGTIWVELECGRSTGWVLQSDLEA